MKAILHAIAGRCPTHDRPAPYLIAELERDTGIDPSAVEKLWDRAMSGGFVEAFADPRIIDCGRRRCRVRRSE